MIQIELIRQLHNQLKLQDAKRRAYQEMYQETYQETSDAGKRLMHLKAESLKAQGKWDYYNNCPLVPDKLLIEMLKEDQMKYTLQAMSDEVEALRQDAERYRWLPDVDELAQHIRWLNGGNKKMGAGALAEKLVDWLRSRV
jgi:hypothetical protein